jgi:hypothetical protein
MKHVPPGHHCLGILGLNNIEGLNKPRERALVYLDQINGLTAVLPDQLFHQADRQHESGIVLDGNIALQFSLVDAAGIDEW